MRGSVDDLPLLRHRLLTLAQYTWHMHWIKALIGIVSVAVSALRSSRLAADPDLPPGSKLLPGRLQRANNGEIAVQQANRPQIRVCGNPSGGDCQFTDLAAAAAAAEPGTEIVLAPGLYEQGAVLAKDGLTLRGESGAHLKGQ